MISLWLVLYMLFYVYLSTQDGYCKFNESVCGASISKFYNTPSGNVSALVMAIYEKGPISVAIDASHRSFSFYANGVYFEKECGKYRGQSNTISPKIFENEIFTDFAGQNTAENFVP